MHSPSITGALNDAYIAEQYEVFLRDPSLVDESWRQFFRLAQQFGASPAATASGVPLSETTVKRSAARDPDFLRKVAATAMLIQSIRSHGHYAVPLDPLGTPPIGAVELTPEFHGISEEDLELIPAGAIGFNSGHTAADVVARLRQLYSSNMGFETEHMDEDRERQWFCRMIEEERFPRVLDADEKRALLERLTEVDGLERFIGRAFVGHKRFSIEGGDVIVPMMDELIESAANAGSTRVVLAMSHRGRINILAHIVGKPYAQVFTEFAGDRAHATTAGSSGDVKYHLGARGERVTRAGRSVHLQLIPNPSHLEFVNPVMVGMARAQQSTDNILNRDETAVLPVCIHGDAAFPGEGVVAETFNLARLQGYSVGGTVHIIVNNQIGYTTNPSEARSTHYASDLAKGFDVPVVHVSADDPEACVAAVRLAAAFRAEFAQDIVIDVVGYRRHGHNEGDEPAYTQPGRYGIIKSHPTVRALWGARLVREGVCSAEEVDAVEAKNSSRLDNILAERDAASKAAKESGEPQQPTQSNPSDFDSPTVNTAVAAEELLELNQHMLSWPADFRIHPRLGKQLEKRIASIKEKGGIDWGQAEALAFASLLREGFSVRLSGQDAQRGTFAHRHAVLHDYENGNSYAPLQHLPRAAGAFEIHNSPLSETSVLGFEYGFSSATADALVMWEAQFGDFVNVAQPVMDQFLFSDSAKWGQESSLVLLLPHGYEGQGPEHSSARLERFLQSCAEGNMRVAYPSTPAQYFHILRRQMKLPQRRPLVLMQPKSLLRRPDAASSLSDLSSGVFKTVLDDPVAAAGVNEVQRLVFCSGKIYYDIIAALAEKPADQRARLAIVRVEELYPWPHDAIGAIVDQYPDVDEIVWAQEEPRNMGAWSYALPRLHASAGNLVRVNYIGRGERASPAEGYKASHDVEQQRIIAAVADLPQAATRKRSSAVRT
jgi:2-oxoglutarate dehydrogenase E1 component